MDALDLFLRIGPMVVYLLASLSYHRRDKRQRAEIAAYRETITSKDQIIVDLCTERDLAVEYVTSLETLVMENEKIVSAADVEIAAAQTRQWLRE